MSLRQIKIALFSGCLVPVLALAWRAISGKLGANPIEAVTHTTGDWTLRFLLITLAITPLRRAMRIQALIRFRRMLGLFAFFYGCLHFMTYVWFDKFFDTGAIWKDIGKRPFITIGFLTFVLLIPLAVTSTAGWIGRLGGKRWARLHRLVYVSAAGAVIHYYWLVKSDVRLPVMYGILLTTLLAFRVTIFVAKRLPKWRDALPAEVANR
jgi:sulfoxide reductase heme-binding subunit YedZ